MGKKDWIQTFDLKVNLDIKCEYFLVCLEYINVLSQWECSLRNLMTFTLFERPDMAVSVLSLWLAVDILGAIDAEERKEVDPKGEYWLLPDLGNDWYE